MARTQIKGVQVENQSVYAEDLNTTTTGKAVITKVVAGSGISLSSSGVDVGTGEVIVSESQEAKNLKLAYSIIF